MNWLVTLEYQAKISVEELRQHGIEVKSHMSSLDDETAELIRDLYHDHDEEIAPLSSRMPQSQRVRQ